MKIFRHLHHPDLAPACALTIGNFDGVHRGHQAMLALLKSEAQHRRLPACVLTFEPHPRDFFALSRGQEDLAPARIATLRDKLLELQRCGVDQVIVARFHQRFANQSAEEFIEQVLVQGLGARYVLVGDDFRFGARRAGDYALLDQAGDQHDFDVARMMSYEVHGQRVSSSTVRQALADGDMGRVAQMLGRAYAISGHVIHGRQLGRQLGFRTLNMAFRHRRCAAAGIYVVRVRGLGPEPVLGVASLGVRPSVENSDRILLETHCLQWPEHLGSEGGYGRCLQVELLHHLHEERHYPSLEALESGIAQDVADARSWWASHGH